MHHPHVLILGGTGEARLLARRLVSAGLRVTLSLAGRTASPLPQAGEVRVGGFGGPDGLAAFIRDNGVGVLVDATHPFAARISANADAAAGLARVRLVALERPAWEPVAGDRWTGVDSVAEAAAALGSVPRRAFLAIGRQELAPFAAHPQHVFLVRSVDPVELHVLPNARFILDRGPFDEAAERRLLEENRIDVVVAKNSGGDATYGKIAAARSLGVPVIMVRRPRAPRPGAVGDVDAAAAQVLHAAGPLPEKRGE